MFLTIINNFLDRCTCEFKEYAKATLQCTPDWIYVYFDRDSLPEQGWKLHVSASILSAEQVLELVLPVLFSLNANFKLVTSIKKLKELNAGRGGLTQIGKFITVYPDDDTHAVSLAVALDKVTRNLRGPAIPSDRPLNQDSLIYYRYGSFGQRQIRKLSGQVLPAIMTPSGEMAADNRHFVYRAPDWGGDPFLAAGVAKNLPPRLLINNRYLIIATLYRSARGAVHLA